MNSHHSFAHHDSSIARPRISMISLWRYVANDKTMGSTRESSIGHQCHIFPQAGTHDCAPHIGSLRSTEFANLQQGLVGRHIQPLMEATRGGWGKRPHPKKVYWTLWRVAKCNGKNIWIFVDILETLPSIVGVSISLIPGPPFGPSWRMTIKSPCK